MWLKSDLFAISSTISPPFAMWSHRGIKKYIRRSFQTLFFIPLRQIVRSRLNLVPRVLLRQALGTRLITTKISVNNSCHIITHDRRKNTRIVLEMQCGTQVLSMRTESRQLKQRSGRFGWKWMVVAVCSNILNHATE